MLEVCDLEVAYDGHQVLWGTSIKVNAGEIVCILGPNGAGKSTLANTISGLVPAKAGTISFLGTRIDRLLIHKRIEMGMAHVLERRRVFPYMSVYENLSLGAYVPRARAKRNESLEWVLSIFPHLKDRLGQAASTLSGGEQQMLAIGRGLMSRPKFLIIDEPYLGLTPKVLHEIGGIMISLNEQEGLTILFIEQNVQEALEHSHRGYVLEAGEIVLEGTSESLMADSRMRQVYLGIED